MHPGQLCQPTQAACMIKPSTTAIPEPAGGSSLAETVCIVSAALSVLGLVAGVVITQCRGRGPEARERLLREAGPAMSLVEVPPTGRRVAIIVTCEHFKAGSPSFDNIDGARGQGLRLKSMFEDELGFDSDFVVHEPDVLTTADFWQVVARLLQRLNGEPHVLLVLYFITHGVDVDFNLHMAMGAAAPRALLDEYYLTKAALQRGFQTIECASDAKRLYNCQPLPYMNVAIFTDTCQWPPPPGATRGVPPEANVRHLQVRDKPARIGFVHACERARPATGSFTEVFLEMAREPRSLDALIDSMRAKLETSTGFGSSVSAVTRAA